MDLLDKKRELQKGHDIFFVHVVIQKKIWTKESLAARVAVVP